MDNRRPSLIDQMAMAAAMEGLVDDSESDTEERIGEDDVEVDDDDDDDDDDASSLENDSSSGFRLRSSAVVSAFTSSSATTGSGGRTSTNSSIRNSLSLRGSPSRRRTRNITRNVSAVSQASRSSSRSSRSASYASTGGVAAGADHIVIGGDERTQNELILDYDVEDDFNDEVVDIIFHDDTQRGERWQVADGRHNQSVDEGVENLYTSDYDERIVYPSDRYSAPGVSRHSGNSNSRSGRLSGQHSRSGGGGDDNEDLASVPSHVDSEGRDQFDDDELIHQFSMNYGWESPRPTENQSATGTASPSAIDGMAPQSTETDMSAMASAPTIIPAGAMLVNADELDDTGGDGSLLSSLDMSGRRPSFNNPRRRTSYASYNSSNSEQSYHSAPNPTVTEAIAGAEMSTGGSSNFRRPRSIAVPNAEGVGYVKRSSGRSSYRRPSVQIKSFAAGATVGASMTGSIVTTSSPMASLGSGNSEGEGSAHNASSIGSAVGLLNFRSRKSRHPRRSSASVQVRGSPFGTLDSAIESLRQQDSNSEWENVAAAVTVVQASEQGASASKSKFIKFAVNDTVLVFLTLLNVTNMEDLKDTFTVAPVNKYGYPSGEGRTDAEKSGPYTFVLCFVKHVHFDEDDRYYTVERADTGTEQRADSGWMEPLNDPDGIEAAARAARKTVRSTLDKPDEVMEDHGILHETVDLFLDIVAWPREFLHRKLFPFYRKVRRGTKRLVSQLLFGESPFSCQIRLTGVNILVLCSIAFLFLEVINLAFLPADLDDEMAIVGAIIWSILALELIFEAIIRPKDYFKLIDSDKAFAPSTARYVNRFHLVFETLALITYIPEFQCTTTNVCTRNVYMSRVGASVKAVVGPTHIDAYLGRLLMGLTSLRFFGVIRHWKQMWISNTFKTGLQYGIEKFLFPRETSNRVYFSESSTRKVTARSKRDDDETFDEEVGLEVEGSETARLEDDQRLKNAATIGTALMVVNSQRALILMVATVIVIPMLGAMNQQNRIAPRFANLLEANNIVALGGSTDCDYLENAIESWLSMAIIPQPPAEVPNVEPTFVLWAQVLPVRCPFQNATGVITSCGGKLANFRRTYPTTCDIWENKAPPTPDMASGDYFAAALNLRPGGIIREFGAPGGRFEALSDFNATIYYNQNPTISLANMGLFYLMLTTLILGLYFLQALRGDAIRLVLDPLQRMLKIVLRYAENPLSPDVDSSRYDDDNPNDVEGEEIGNFETEQLINAISKIADLLRKCWGVAGAGIISSNLARTKDGKTVVFNPTVPGKRVYALFGFVAINGFGELLRSLDRDVMILINDVAKVVHDEVYRWALGEHGQCNKNLGPAFLMVWRIGDFSEVHKKKQVATAKLFQDKEKKKTRSTMRRRQRTLSQVPNAGRRQRGSSDSSVREIQLESLPGIQAFTDRALLGMLKSFAGIHRDKSLNIWKNDFRLSAGVSAYNADIMYGMDAGWAVEGAVGSEYKIDATYLSPHVNMASRMMSATKQYGVTILVSKAVQKLLSKNCRKKLRHIDTVYVKGSHVKQDIFTYDARFEGVDFFLLERTPEQADMESEAYSPSIWDQDQDLRAMRQHVSDGFMETYHLAIKQYLDGNWQEAYKNFHKADSDMINRVLEDGYLEIDTDDLDDRIFDLKDQSEDIVRVRQQLGDGACRALMNFIDRRNRTAPADWDAVRQLYSK